MSEIVRISLQEITKLDLSTFKQATKAALDDDSCREEWVEFLSTTSWVLLHVPLKRWVIRMIPWMLKTGRYLGR